MIFIDQYLGLWAKSKDLTAARLANANKLLLAVNGLMVEMEADGVNFPVNPATHSQVSGATFGGFRPHSCPQGAPHSNHKEGLAVDIYDPKGEIDAWLVAHKDRMEYHGVYIEDPASTTHWSHWQNIAPHSGHRIFQP